jgi:hypothetical protein
MPGEFADGFTSKKDSHGFGLNKAALPAKLGGSPTVQRGFIKSFAWENQEVEAQWPSA